MSDKNNNSHGHHGLLAGLLIGLLFAMIFAPQKGRFVREKIKKAHSSGDDALEPLKHSLYSLFSEVVRVAKTTDAEKNEKNPFTITNIRNYAGK